MRLQFWGMRDGIAACGPGASWPGAALALGLALLGLPGLALAQDAADPPPDELIGEVALTFDAADMRLGVYSSEYEGEVFGSAALFAGDPDNEAADQDILMIAGTSDPAEQGPAISIYAEFPPTAPGAIPEIDPETVEITYSEIPDELPYWTSGADGVAPPQIRIESFEFDREGPQTGKRGSVKGSFSGRLCEVRNWDAGMPDPKNCRLVEGTFDTLLFATY